MLSRNLIYTGLTRARKLAIVVGTTKAIGLAVKQVKDTERYTYLQERLRLMFIWVSDKDRLIATQQLGENKSSPSRSIYFLNLVLRLLVWGKNPQAKSC